MSTQPVRRSVVVIANASSRTGSACANTIAQSGATVVSNHPPTSTSPSSNASSDEAHPRYALHNSDQLVAGVLAKIGHIDVAVYGSDQVDASITEASRWKGMREDILKGAFKVRHIVLSLWTLSPLGGRLLILRQFAKAIWPSMRAEKSGTIVYYSQSLFGA